ncbi:MAG: hypothetical protein INR65_09465 [Gluconacetobacter diazotrophicus]|nr:hypothetical protein [Gluconacetobacter diazotrophicus]
MTDERTTAMRALQDAIDAENDLLRRGEYGAIGPNIARKAQALARLEQAVAAENGETDGEHRRLAASLHGAIEENRILLLQGMEVQTRIMGLIAGAARRTIEPNGYRAGGRPARSPDVPAMALSTRG